MQVIQINLQPQFGGGEVYTKFLCRAFDTLGISTTLIHLDEALFWRGMNLPGSTQLRPVPTLQAVIDQLPSQPSWLLTHGTLTTAIASQVASSHLLTGIAHMPPQGRPRDRYEHYARVFGVSTYVLEGLRAIGAPVWDIPLYGVADLDRAAAHAPICRASCYDWDRRKGRDRLLGMLEPLTEPFRRRPEFHRRNGLTLGVVSRLTPIKQLPQLFSIIAPRIARCADINVEIFGAGGYASVRDLRRATAPMKSQVRFWGYQRDVKAVYANIDYLLTGLPEKEALGLNVIEAQACGVPAISVNAPPFTETVLNNRTGLLYTDPRLDGGEDFTQTLLRLIANPLHIERTADVTRHLARFSEEAFVERIGAIVEHIKKLL